MGPPTQALVQGAQVLSAVLLPNGFTFVFREEGRSSGGDFAWGEFVRGDRKLEIHFRHNLGMVRYHVGRQSASHEAYMRELGVSERCCYPGYDVEPAIAFHDLAHDLTFAKDFLSGSAETLKRTAVKEASAEAERHQEDMARYVGDVRKLEELHGRFKQGKYEEVVSLANNLKYPDRMTDSERRMVQIARQRATKADPKTTEQFLRRHGGIFGWSCAAFVLVVGWFDFPPAVEWAILLLVAIIAGLIIRSRIRANSFKS